jgi:hypothetical protein
MCLKAVVELFSTASLTPPQKITIYFFG